MKIIAFLLALSLLSVGSLFLAGCQTPAQKSMAAYKENAKKFEELLPKWQKYVPDSEEKNFKPDNEGVFRKGKVIFLDRELDSSSTDVPLKLSNYNIISDNHESDLIAATPEEVGTIIVLDTMTDQTKRYSNMASYTNNKVRIFMIDAGTGEIKKRRELKLDRFDPPATIKSGVILYPTEALNQFFAEIRKPAN